MFCMNMFLDNHSYQNQSNSGLDLKDWTHMSLVAVCRDVPDALLFCLGNFAHKGKGRSPFSEH